MGLDSETFGAARSMLNQAVTLDPTNAQARRELAWLAVLGWVFRLDKLRYRPTRSSHKRPRQSSSILPTRARTWSPPLRISSISSSICSSVKPMQAIALAPYDAEIMATLAYMTASAGDQPAA